MSVDFNKAPIFIDPKTGFEMKPLAEGDDALAAAMLAEATGENTSEAAQAVMDRARSGGKDRVIGGWLEDELIGAYTIERDGMANQVTLIAVVPDKRKKGFGKTMLMDALRRSGRRPLTAETDEDSLEFYKKSGFKMVGRRKHPSGVFRYRVGWHAPREHDELKGRFG